MDLFDEPGVAEFKALMQDPAARQAFVELKAQNERSGTRVRYEHILKAVSETPWAIRPQILAVIIDVLAFRAQGGRFTAEEIEARIGSRSENEPEIRSGIAVLPLHGVMIPKAGSMREMSGGTSVERFRAGFRAAMASKEVKGILIDVDSPGGMVDQVPEMASEIRSARGSKPIVALANTEANSAAYWLASQADRMLVSKSARVGSIGVFTAHEDESKQQELEGIKTTLVSAGKFKTEGNPFEPLSIEAKETLQGMVNDYYGMFVSDVARGRGVNVEDVRNGFGEGRVVGARDAIRLRMADGVSTFEQAVSSLVPSASDSVLLGSVTVPIYAGFDPAREDRMTEEDFMAADSVDNSAWDGNRAMGECSSASDYRSICAGEHTVGQPDERQHWALPHHYLGRGPNADGVRNALSRLPQTQNLANRAAAQSHLDAHQAQINPSASSDKLRYEAEIAELEQ